MSDFLTFLGGRIGQGSNEASTEEQNLEVNDHNNGQNTSNTIRKYDMSQYGRTGPTYTQLVNDFQTEVAELKSKFPSSEEIDLARFFYGSNFDMAQAIEKYEKHLQWREDFLKKINVEDISDELATGTITTSGVDKDGQPFLYIQIKNINKVSMNSSTNEGEGNTTMKLLNSVGNTAISSFTGLWANTETTTNNNTANNDGTQDGDKISKDTNTQDENSNDTNKNGNSLQEDVNFMKLQYFIYIIEECLTKIDRINEIYEREGKTNQRIMRYSAIIDIQEISFSHLNLPFFNLLTDTLKKNYPERLSRILLYPCNSLLNIIWNMIKDYIPERPRNKIIFLTKAESHRIFEYIDQDQLPPSLAEEISDESKRDKLERNAAIEDDSDVTPRDT